MNGFDLGILTFLNQFANRWPWIDETVAVVANKDLFKGGLILAILWWVWFLPGREIREKREAVAATLAAAFGAVATARFLSLVLPHRLRPILALGAGAPNEDWAEWSAFPSDHAALFVALAAGLFCVSRRLGAAVMAYVLVVICLPRLYLGLHYPTDILAGSALGLAWTALLLRPSLRRRIAAPVLAFEARSPAAFYGAAFLFSYLVATLFADVRDLGSVWLSVLRRSH